MDYPVRVHSRHTKIPVQQPTPNSVISQNVVLDPYLVDELIDSFYSLAIKHRIELWQKFKGVGGAIVIGKARQAYTFTGKQLEITLQKRYSGAPYTPVATYTIAAAKNNLLWQPDLNSTNHQIRYQPALVFEQDTIKKVMVNTYISSQELANYWFNQTLKLAEELQNSHP